MQGKPPDRAFSAAGRSARRGGDVGRALEFARGKAGSRRGTFWGSYDTVADRLAQYARLGAIDGLNITPWLIPSGLDDIVEELVPRLQERGVYPAEYAGSTLRENLGLPPL